MCSVICNLHTKSALTSSAGITGPVKSTQAGLQRRKPNHIRLFLRIRNTTSPCPPQFNTNSLAVRVLVLGLSQRPSGEVTKLGVLGQKTSAGKKADPSVTTKWSGGLRQRPVGDGGGGVLQGHSRPGSQSLTLTSESPAPVFLHLEQGLNASNALQSPNMSKRHRAKARVKFTSGLSLGPHLSVLLTCNALIHFSD